MRSLTAFGTVKIAAHLLLHSFTCGLHIPYLYLEATLPVKCRLASDSVPFSECVSVRVFILYEYSSQCSTVSSTSSTKQQFPSRTKASSTARPASMPQKDLLLCLSFCEDVASRITADPRLRHDTPFPHHYIDTCEYPAANTISDR
jgi:hypothetical protein